MNGETPERVIDPAARREVQARASRRVFAELAAAVVRPRTPVGRLDGSEPGAPGAGAPTFRRAAGVVGVEVLAAGRFGHRLHAGNVGFDPVYGARPLKRAIQAQVENPLASRILAGEFGQGDTVRVDAQGGQLVFARG